ncbi:hypothetical protein GGR53DRAFT_465693 [Hypoxylon sp. FL1150]|nr:hypothetical protein GGR53DRAFT_465693 [Hypoxylon sp. FL1150]
MPQGDPEETDLFLLLMALLCPDLDAMYTNAMFPSEGRYCRWFQGPFAPPPALPMSAWLTFAEDGSVAKQ